MDIESGMRQLTYARNTPFRDEFKRFVGNEIPPTLSDEAIALVLVVSTLQMTANDRITEYLPPTCRNHFAELLMMRTVRGDFFTRFALFGKSAGDGLLVGFGTDEMYYVVASWDEWGCDLWKPGSDLFDRPVLA